MEFADIGLAVLTLFGLSAGVFWLSVHGWRVPGYEHRRDPRYSPANRTVLCARRLGSGK